MTHGDPLGKYAPNSSQEPKFSRKIPYLHIVAGQAYAFNNFDRFDIGFTREDVKKYYADKSSRTQLDMSTGIAIKPRNF